MSSSASRGLGLELVARLLEDPTNDVVASCRNPDEATALQALKTAQTTKGKLHVVRLDVDDPASIRSSYDEVSRIFGDRGLDVLYNNAGVVRTTSRALSPHSLTSSSSVFRMCM